MATDDTRIDPSLPLAKQTVWHRAGRAVIATLQRALYRIVLVSKTTGMQHVPTTGGFLVASNHASHLDAGLIKLALGERGREMRALAARDYFFAQAWSRWYFTHFTNVLPFDRNGGFRASLKRAVGLVQSGKPLLIFPEGTRSLTGKMAPFRPAVVSIALAADCPILPMCLLGTHEALPKGGVVLRSRHVCARVGPAIAAETLRAITLGLSRHEAYRRATQAVEMAVVALQAGQTLSNEALLAHWRRVAVPPRPARSARPPGRPEDPASAASHPAREQIA